MTLTEFNNLFIEDCQYIRLYDLANEDEICFEGQICEMPKRYNRRRIILFETMTEEDFDGYFGIFIATKNENEYYDNYNSDENDDE